VQSVIKKLIFQIIIYF